MFAQRHLQADVRPTLELLRNAGIKVWGFVNHSHKSFAHTLSKSVYSEFSHYLSTPDQLAAGTSGEERKGE